MHGIYSAKHCLLRRASKIHELQDDINDICSKTIFSFEKKILSNVVRGRLTGLFR